MVRPEPMTETASISISFPCIKISQPIGDFFVGVMKSKDLCSISDFDVRRVLQEERDVERYLGIQRPLNDARVADLKRYVHFYDATFPTSIIIAVPGECAVYNAGEREMTLSNYLSDDKDQQVLFKYIARVLDGQHRVAGLIGYSGEDFDVNVTIFVGIDIAEQASIFSTVNLEQTKVNKSLAYDLFDLAKSRSPQKTCHNVVVALDQDKTSSFYKRIKRLGTSTEGRYGETLTQATFVEALMRYISTDPKEDRDALLRGRKISLASNTELQKVPLRNLFIEGNDIDIAKIMWNYFDAVRNTWPDAWNDGGRGMILNKTNGFRALMRVFRPAYLYVQAPGSIATSEQFKRVFSKTKVSDDYFTIENFPPGSSGEALLTKHLIEDLRLSPQPSLPFPK
jgi:DGQHR domain-containing protein